MAQTTQRLPHAQGRQRAVLTTTTADTDGCISMAGGITSLSARPIYAPAHIVISMSDVPMSITNPNGTSAVRERL
jgi:hypothetical protein